MGAQGSTSDFENRLRKNARHRFKWARRERLTAFRCYDSDVREWPVAVDWYDGYAHVGLFPRQAQARDGLDDWKKEVVDATARVLEIPEHNVFAKMHIPHAWGRTQYEKLGKQGVTHVVEEFGLKFEVNLSDYLDTGLFLDHRNTRLRVQKEAQGKKVLNLFAYTGSFSVHARAGGAAETTTVDMSNTYCEWAERNFALNAQEPSPRHRVVRDDVIAWLAHATGRFDLIVLDPPSFSASKNMGRSFDIQRDHVKLVEQTLAKLNPGGVLYFSTNFRGFTLDGRFKGASELTPKSLPEDFRTPSHRCFRF